MPVTVQNLKTVTTDKGQVAVTLIREVTAGFVKEKRESTVMTFTPIGAKEKVLLGQFEPHDNVEEIVNDFLFNQLKPVWVFRGEG